MRSSAMRKIERKFLVVGDEWRKLATGDHLRQGYLNHRAGVTVRVRQAGQHAFLTIKSQPTGIIVRSTNIQFQEPMQSIS